MPGLVYPSEFDHQNVLSELGHKLVNREFEIDLNQNDATVQSQLMCLYGESIPFEAFYPIGTQTTIKLLKDPEARARQEKNKQSQLKQFSNEAQRTWKSSNISQQDLVQMASYYGFTSGRIVTTSEQSESDVAAHWEALLLWFGLAAREDCDLIIECVESMCGPPNYTISVHLLDCLSYDSQRRMIRGFSKAGFADCTHIFPDFYYDLGLEGVPLDTERLQNIAWDLQAEEDYSPLDLKHYELLAHEDPELMRCLELYNTA